MDYNVEYMVLETGGRQKWRMKQIPESCMQLMRK